MSIYGKIGPDGQPAGANRNTPEQAVTAFEKAYQDALTVQYGQRERARAVWNACAAEAERLCRQETSKLARHGGMMASIGAENCAERIAKLAEVDR